MCITTLSLLSCASPSSTVALASYVPASSRLWKVSAEHQRLNSCDSHGSSFLSTLRFMFLCVSDRFRALLAAVSDRPLAMVDYYYFATAGGKRIWVRLDSILQVTVPIANSWVTQWKKYLTTMQITQFVIDLFAVYFGSEYDLPTYRFRRSLTEICSLLSLCDFQLELAGLRRLCWHRDGCAVWMWRSDQLPALVHQVLY